MFCSFTPSSAPCSLTASARVQGHSLMQPCRCTPAQWLPTRLSNSVTTGIHQPAAPPAITNTGGYTHTLPTLARPTSQPLPVRFGCQSIPGRARPGQQTHPKPFLAWLILAPPGPLSASSCPSSPCLLVNGQEASKEKKREKKSTSPAQGQGRYFGREMVFPTTVRHGLWEVEEVEKR